MAHTKLWFNRSEVDGSKGDKEQGGERDNQLIRFCDCEAFVEMSFVNYIFWLQLLRVIFTVDVDWALFSSNIAI